MIMQRLGQQSHREVSVWVEPSGLPKAGLYAVHGEEPEERTHWEEGSMGWRLGLPVVTFPVLELLPNYLPF